VPNSFTAAELGFLGSLACSSVFADQAAYGLPALDPGSNIDRLTGLVQRRSLVSRLMRPVVVVVLGILNQDPSEVLSALDQQVVQALAAQCSHEALGDRVRLG
jgi:hypothetical protein